MTEPMIDWWTVPGHTWGVRNLDFKVELTPDRKSRTDPYDGYSEHQIETLLSGHWRFVTLRVVPVDRELNDLTQYEVYLGSVEWGDMPDGRVDRDSVTAYQALDMAHEAVRDALAGGFRLEVEEGSQFAPERLAVPF